LPARACHALNAFLILVDMLDRNTQALPLPLRVDHVIEHSGLLAMYRKEKDGKGEARVDNLQELVNAAAEPPQITTVVTEADEPLDELSAFLAHASLEAGEGQAESWEDCVQLMTLHSAKGLEFPVVFLVGVEEGLFPHQQSLQETGRLEEERRLAYVGITRARRRLCLSYAEKRRLHGRDTYPRPSRFVTEIPAGLLQDIRTRAALYRPISGQPLPAAADKDALRSGQAVRHPSFGIGIVQAVEGQGAHMRVQVKFAAAGAKWLVLAYAKLERL
jgi:DNA helicase-2/ATP-dependent DNA helicase PcrA